MGQEALRRNQYTATVAASVPLCREHWSLWLRLPAFPPTAPGQFIQISCRDLEADYSPQRELDWQPGVVLDLEGRELMSPLALLRRPFSLGGRRDGPEGVELQIIHRTVGVGTRWLSELRPGDGVHLLGPLGNSFEPPPAQAVAVLVGGGVGIPPMLYLAQRLGELGRKAVAFCGATTRDLLPLTVTADAPSPGPDSVDPLYNIDEFARHGVPAVISTDDGSYGFRGFVTQAMERYLDRYLAGTKRPVVVYTCGPEAMMKRVAQIAAARAMECQVSVERAMACGMGTCQSCCIKVKKSDPSQPPLPGRDWCWRLACTDGPVFKGEQLLW